MIHGSEPSGPVVVIHLKIVDKSTGAPNEVEPEWIDMTGRDSRCWKTEIVGPASLRYVLPREMATDPEVGVFWSVPGYFVSQAPLSQLVDAAELAAGEADGVIELEPATSAVNRYRVIDAETGLPVPGAIARQLSGLRGGSPEVAFGDSKGHIEVPTRLSEHQAEMTANGYRPRYLRSDPRPRDMGDFELTPDRIDAALIVRISSPWPDSHGAGGWLGLRRIGPDIASEEFGVTCRGWDADSVAEHVRMSSHRHPDRIGDWQWFTTSPGWSREGLLPGDYVVVARDVDGACAVAQVHLAAGSKETLWLELSEGSPVRIHGAVAPGERLRLVPREWGPRAQIAVGSAKVVHVPPGVYDVVSVLASGGVVRGGVLDVAEGVEASVTVPPLPKVYRVTGRLLKRSETKPAVPLAGAAVHVPEGPPVQTDGTGTFTLEGLPPGTYVLLIDGFRPVEDRQLRFEVAADPPGGELSLGDIVVGNPFR